LGVSAFGTKDRMHRRVFIGLLILTTIVSPAAFAATAHASKLLDRDTRWQSLKVDKNRVALVTYFARGHTVHALLWGAVNALPPNAAHPKSQLKFKVNYAGGRGSSLGAGYWRKVSAHNVCGPYTGPALYGLVTACTAPDGSNWALQAWQRDLPDNGWNPKTSAESAWELHVSHWSGPLPNLWFKMDWIYAKAPGGPFDHLYGMFTYRGHAVYGFGSNSAGAPTDSFGRLVSMDTLKPPWKRGLPAAGRLVPVQHLPRPPAVRRLLRGRVRHHRQRPHPHAAGPRQRVSHHRQRARRHPGRLVAGLRAGLLRGRGCSTCSRPGPCAAPIPRSSTTR